MHDGNNNIAIGKKILGENEHMAEHNRAYFKKCGLFVVNLMGSPGSGKTMLLEKTISQLQDIKIGVVEGDIEGDTDKIRVETAGAAMAIQINTFGACHLLAHQIEHALKHMNVNELKLLFIENVGNLVCPAEFDLGENVRVMVLGVTEGADKPLKYPLMFQKAKALVINKMDIIEYSGCDLNLLIENIQKINPRIKIFELSSRTGQGISNWIEWLRKEIC